MIATTAALAYAPNFITKIIQEQTHLEPDERYFAKFPTGEAVNVDHAGSPTSTRPTNLVRTRFPPEPNGYLHLGHAKAVCFNFAVAKAFGGTCNMRLDDTNPSKEDSEYVESILQDVTWIMSDGDSESSSPPWNGPVRKTSDYFQTIFECALALIQSGDAFVDSLNADEMREYRGSLTEPGIDSPYKGSRSIAENVQLFLDMKDGKYPDGAHVVRAKIDMASPNINLRDPVLYRIKHESHQETGGAYSAILEAGLCDVLCLLAG
jgi:glutaminyl-tRNA synthetase